MDLDEVLLSMVFGGSIASAMGFFLAWLSARGRARRLEDDLRGRGTGAPEGFDLEVRVNALAAQVEELARSQDFLHRLITQRLERLPAPPDRPREITPH